MRLEIENLKESNDFLNIVFDSIVSSIFIVDKEMIIRSLNNSGSNLLKRDADGIVGKKCGEGLGCEYEYAELNGCGNNSVCKSCSIRLDIGVSFIKKTPVTDAILDRRFKIGDKLQRKIFKYSTKYITYQNEKMVILILNDITEEEERKETLNHQFLKIKELNSIFEEELEIAAKVQETILPKSSEIDSFKEFYVKYTPYSKVSGDYYDIVDIGEEKQIIFLIDITGHGVPAALYTTFIKSAIIYSARIEKSASGILKSLNKIVCDIVLEGYYFPAIAVVIDKLKKEVSYATSGGPKLVRYIREENRAVQIEGIGMMLGIDSSYEYEESFFEYKEGDRLYFYTDGIMALRNSYGEIENVKDEDILRLLASNGEKSIKELIENLSKEIRKEYNNGVYEDDITILGLEL